MRTIREQAVGRATLRLVETTGVLRGVILRGGKPPEATDLLGAAAEAAWQQLLRLAAEADPQFIGYDGAQNRFLRIFPGGFRSPEYRDSERDYKDKARKLLNETIPLDRAAIGPVDPAKVAAVFARTNLVSPFEKMRLQEALRTGKADRFVAGAAHVAQGDLERGLAEMAAALEPSQAVTWPILTYLPFLWRTDEHMFLKPSVTRDFARRVGHPFAETYRPPPEVETYRSLLELVAELEGRVADLAPRDRIDLQSFIWVVGEYPVDAEKGLGSDGTSGPA